MSEIKNVFDKITDHAEPEADSWNRQEKMQHRRVRNRKVGAIALSAALIVGLATAFILTRPNGNAGGPAAGGGTNAAVARCGLGDLKINAGRSQGAAGSIGGIFILENTSAKTCTLEGYPGMQLLNAKGKPITTHVIRGSSVVVPSIPVTLVKIAPGVRASFLWGYSDVSTAPCPTSTSVEVTPPNDFNHVTLTAAMSPCGGRITVSPVRLGTAMP